MWATWYDPRFLKNNFDKFRNCQKFCFIQFNIFLLSLRIYYRRILSRTFSFRIETTPTCIAVKEEDIATRFFPLKPEICFVSKHEDLCIFSTVHIFFFTEWFSTLFFLTMIFLKETSKIHSKKKMGYLRCSHVNFMVGLGQ